MHGLIKTLAIFLTSILMIGSSPLKTEDYQVPTVYIAEKMQEKPDAEVVEKEITILSSRVEKTEEKELLSQEEIELIALVTMAEAEGECEEGKRLVISTILNRVDSDRFPNTVKDVIYQPYQFTSVRNGRMGRCRVTDDICQLVREELQTRTNRDVIYFSAGRYSSYGSPMFQVGNHYFSSN